MHAAGKQAKQNKNKKRPKINKIKRTGKRKWGLNSKRLAIKLAKGKEDSNNNDS